MKNRKHIRASLVYLVIWFYFPLAATADDFADEIQSMAVCLGPADSEPNLKSKQSKGSPNTATSGSVASISMKHNNRGVELGSKGLWTDAIHEHEKAVQADPENATFTQNLSSVQLHYADLLASKEKWDEAIDHYRKALYADPANMSADSHLDSALRASGKNPQDYSVRAELADVAFVTGDYPVAIVEYRKCIKLSDTGPNRFRLARVLYKQGKLLEAYEELRSAIGKKWKLDEINEQSTCHCLMGDILLEMALKAKEQKREVLFLKRITNASICYRRSVALNPANPDAIKGLTNVQKANPADNFDR